jgi:hypothetical protein
MVVKITRKLEALSGILRTATTLQALALRVGLWHVAMAK